MAGVATKWSEEKVIDAILERKRLGLALNSAAIRKEDSRLRGAIELYFGNTSKALLAAGIDPGEIRLLTFWDKEKIKTEFLRVKNQVTGVQDLARKYRALDHAIRKHYGTYDALCDDLGLDVVCIRKQVKEWKGDDLLAVLRTMKDEGQSLNITNVLCRFPTAPQVAARCFGSYENALTAIGEDIRDHIYDMNRDSYLGKSFERELYSAFKALGLNYRYQKRLANGSIMPDFWDEENATFIDAKLSSWSVFQSDTIGKYMPHCEKLVIVYLRGREIEHDIPNLELRHVSYYFPTLIRTGNRSIVDRIERVLHEAESSRVVGVVA